MAVGRIYARARIFHGFINNQLSMPEINGDSSANDFQLIHHQQSTISRQRQKDAEFRAFSRLAFHLDVTPVRFDNHL